MAKNVADEMGKIPLSNNTASTTRRTSAISGNISEQLIQRIKAGSKFAIQLDETTDTTDNANLLVYVRYIYNNDINEDLLFCKALDKRTTGMHIFWKIDVFAEMGLQWKDCVGVCTDGAAAMKDTQSDSR